MRVAIGTAVVVLVVTIFHGCAAGNGVAYSTATVSIANSQCPQPTCADVALGFRQQQTDLWCWAASGEMIMDPMLDVDQCDEAKKFLGRRDCCKRPTPYKCVSGGFPPFRAFGFKFEKTSDAALPWSTLMREILAGFPIAFSWHWRDDIDSGHMMVIIGYEDGDTDETRLLHVLEPMFETPDPGLMTYSFYQQGTDHTHWNDFYHVRR